MGGHLIATGAELLDLHFVGMGPLVAAGEVILFAADGAFQDDLIAFASHLSHSPLFGRVG